MFKIPITIIFGGDQFLTNGTMLPGVVTIVVVAYVILVSFAAYMLYSDRVYLKKFCPEALTIMDCKKTKSSLLLIPDNANNLAFERWKKEDDKDVKAKSTKGLQIDPAILSGAESYTLQGANIKAHWWPINCYFPVGDKSLRAVHQILKHVRTEKVVIEEEPEYIDGDDDEY